MHRETTALTDESYIDWLVELSHKLISKIQHPIRKGNNNTTYVLRKSEKKQNGEFGGGKHTRRVSMVDYEGKNLLLLQNFEELGPHLGGADGVKEDFNGRLLL